VVGTLDWGVDAGEPELLHRKTLLVPSGGFGFLRDRADDGGTYALAFDPLDGGRRWLAQVIEPGQQGSVAGAVAAGDGGLAALVQLTEPDGGDRAELQVFIDGDKLLSCPLLPGTRIGASVFGAGVLDALVYRDGGWMLEVYDLSGAPLDLNGWPSPNGVAGTRREH
jgi:hypothetical protein